MPHGSYFPLLLERMLHFGRGCVTLKRFFHPVHLFFFFFCVYFMMFEIKWEEGLSKSLSLAALFGLSWRPEWDCWLLE